jgi:hypothetical protein
MTLEGNHAEHAVSGGAYDGFRLRYGVVAVVRFAFGIRRRN